MNLIEQIQNDRQKARIEGNKTKAEILTVLVGEIDRLKGKEEITDKKVEKIIRKWIENNKELLDMAPEDSEVILEEIRVLDVYLQAMPSLLTEDEIVKIFAQNANNFATIKDVMTFFKTHYAGLYDGKVVSQLFQNK